MDPHYAAAWAWAGNYPVPVGQAGGLAPGRHAESRWSSTGQSGVTAHRGAPLAVHARHRRRARPSSTVAGIPVPSSRGRDRPGADARREPSPARSTDPAAPERHTQQYFEIHRQPGDVQGRLVARLDADPANPVGQVAPRATLQPYAPGVWEPGQTIRPSCTTCPTISARRTTWPAEHPEKVAELKDLFWARGRAVPGAAAARRPFPPSSAWCRRVPQEVRFELPRRRPERRCRG